MGIQKNILLSKHGDARGFVGSFDTRKQNDRLKAVIMESLQEACGSGSQRCNNKDEESAEAFTKRYYEIRYW